MIRDRKTYNYESPKSFALKVFPTLEESLTSFKDETATQKSKHSEIKDESVNVPSTKPDSNEASPITTTPESTINRSKRSASAPASLGELSDKI